MQPLLLFINAIIMLYWLIAGIALTLLVFVIIMLIINEREPWKLNILWGILLVGSVIVALFWPVFIVLGVVLIPYIYLK